LYLLSEVRPDAQLVVGHVRHGLRDDEADARLAARHAAALEVGYLERSVAVARTGDGPEADARKARYGALSQMAEQVGARAVLAGHSADDQAETVLMNLVRGSGLTGISGMAPQRDLDGRVLLRPLLGVRRVDIRAYIQGEGLDVAHDPTNTDVSQRRARVRMRALPALASLAGGDGDVVGALTRLADLARMDAAALDRVAVTQGLQVVHAWGPARCVRYADLSNMPVALATRVVRMMVDQVQEHAGSIDTATVWRLLELAPGQALSVSGGAWATSGAGWLGIRPEGDRLRSAFPAIRVEVPGATALMHINAQVHADQPWETRQNDGDGQPQLPGGVWEQAAPTLDRAATVAPASLAAPPPGPTPRMDRMWVVLPASVAESLSIRARLPGDRLRTASGRRKLQDLFTDQGVPRAIRDLVPVVVDKHDEPVWIPGIGSRHMDIALTASVRLWLTPLQPADTPKALDDDDPDHTRMRYSHAAG
jgi:tRNA(Ile)-lysidine synthase